MREHEYFPLFFSSEGKRVLVVGGGKIAERRVRTLLQFRFAITVISPELAPGLRELCGEGLFRWEACRYGGWPETGVDLALACTDSPEVNAKVCADARADGVPANRCDSREDCDFYFPAIAANREVVAGLAGDGGSHAATKAAAEKVREVLL